jgi:hypothetical protein
VLRNATKGSMVGSARGLGIERVGASVTKQTSLVAVQMSHDMQSMYLSGFECQSRSTLRRPVSWCAKTNSHYATK